MSANLDWSGTTGDIWSRHWRATDRGLERVGAALDAAILRLAPDRPFRVLDVGSGPGTTSLSLAARRPDAEIVGCDIAQSLIAIARERAGDAANILFVAEDAEAAARERGPFDLIVSRHGVMFFDDPERAFRVLRDAARPGGALVFSCFQAWEANPWASALANAAAGTVVPAPGREAGGFAFADADYVRELLSSAGWSEPTAEALTFRYVAGEGPDAVGEAMEFLGQLGPAARILEGKSGDARAAASSRMREVIEAHLREETVEFAGAAWIWVAEAK